MEHRQREEWFAGSPVSLGHFDPEAGRTMRELARATAAGYEPDHLHAVLSRAHVGILHRDNDERVLMVNDAYCALLGLSRDALDGIAFEQFTHPEDRERSRRVYDQHFATGTPFEIEKRYVRPDGTAMWCAVHVSFIIDDGGRTQSTIAVAHDISARKTAERELRESEEHYRHTVELNPQIAWRASPDGAVIDVSPRWHEVTGVAQAAALGEQWLATVHRDDAEPTWRQWERSLATHDPIDVEYRLRTAGGAFRWFRSRAAVRLDDAGDAVCWYGTLEDIHDRRTAEDAVRDSEERFRLAAGAAGLGIWDYDALAGRRQWSDEFKSMLGLPADVVPSIHTALALIVPKDRHLLKALVEAAQSGDTSARFEVALRVRRADTGAERWMQTDGWRMHATSGLLTRVLVTIRDVTEERTAADKVRWAATHDGLTGIPNRSHFTEQLEQAIAHADHGENLALVLFDVDRLKDVNDTIGHDAGDALLCTFAARLASTFDPGVIVGRLGGDEFAVLLRGLEREEVSALVGRILLALHEPFEYDSHVRDTRATAGASLFPTDGATAADLLKTADIALYSGKNSRRGTLSLFHQSMRASLQKRASMLNVASIVVRDGRIVPHYQPKVSLVDRRVTGFEALLRWRHDALGIQQPSTIAAAFEDMNLAVAMSDAMLEQIAQDMRSWLDEGHSPGKIAINLSPAEFRHEDLVTRVLKPFERERVPLDLLELEITETVLLGRDTEKIAATLTRFRSEGITIALDDFGTGFASLTHLKAFPVDVIKIDRSFIANLCDRSDDRVILDAIIGLAHKLDLSVVAEGIENEKQARYLSARRCDSAQGFLFGRAVSGDAVRNLLVAKASGHNYF